MYHDVCFFGLAECDRKLTGARKNGFKVPDEDTRDDHAVVLRELHEKIMKKPNNSNATLSDNQNSNIDNTQEVSIDIREVPGIGQVAAL